MRNQNISYQLPVAASILFQGYYLIKAFKEGIEEIVDESEGEVVISKNDMSHLMKFKPAEEDPTKIFGMFKDGILNAQRVYDAACQLSPSLKNDQKLKYIFDRLNRQDYNFSINEAVYASRKILEGYR